MKKICALLFFTLAIASFVQSQSIERKLIIQNKEYFFSTIDEEFQIATLHRGSVAEPLKSAKKLAVPAGRNYNDPVNPFSWDIRKKDLFAVNFLIHPMNDFNEAIKKIPLNSLREWDGKITVTDMLMTSVDHHLFVYNDPYMFTIRRSNTLNNFFSDAVFLGDSSLCMVIANNDELIVWNHNGKEWSHGAIQPFKADGFFTLVPKGKDLMLITNSGIIYWVYPDSLSPSEKKLAGSLADGILVEDRDSKSVSYLKRTDWDSSLSIKKLLVKKGQKLF